MQELKFAFCYGVWGIGVPASKRDVAAGRTTHTRLPARLLRESLLPCNQNGTSGTATAKSEGRVARDDRYQRR